MVYDNDKAMEVHQGVIRSDDGVLVVDDVLASGGSALAAVKLIERSDARCIAVSCIADMTGFSYRDEIEAKGIPIYALASL